MGQIWIPNPNDPKANPYRTPPQRAVLSSPAAPNMEALPGVQKAAIGLAKIDLPLPQ